jgi:hypothetical protein
MVCPRLIIAVGWLLATRAFAGPLDDLGSQSQEVRDAAAGILRESFTPVPQSHWEPVIAAIKPGDSKESVLRHLPRNVNPELGPSTGQSYAEFYRLDDSWLLSCAYRRSNTGDTLLRHELIERVRHVWIAPPADFTGVWTTYFVNGRRSHEIHYVNGSYLGVFTAFHANGSVAVVQHIGLAGADGEDTGYYPSGAVMYQGQYRNGAQIGTWTHYNEDGSIRAITEHSEH